MSREGWGERVGAVKRLRGLPDVFNLDELAAATGWERKTAAQTCWRWKGEGLIQALGPRNVGVYYNLIANTDAPQTRRYAALQKLLGSPMLVIGAATLHAHGWTTQQPLGMLEVAVPVRRGAASLPTLDGIKLVPRYGRWFSVLWTGQAPGIEGFPTASPEAALADAMLAAHRGRANPWAPDSDDIASLSEDQIAAVDDFLLNLSASPAERSELLRNFKPDVGSGGFVW